MVTEFGKALRKIRIDNDEVLATMAKKLKVSVSYLSAIENGNRNIPDDFVNMIVEKYHLDEAKEKELIAARKQSISNINISLSSAIPAQKELAFALSRTINDLTEEECESLLKTLKR